MPCDEQEFPGLRRIVCALILGADHPVSDAEICRVIDAVAEERASAAAAVDGAAAEAPRRKVSAAAVREAVEELKKAFRGMDAGIELAEAAGGYRLQTCAECGPWVRKMLNRDKPAKLAKPAVETLAIIAYKQPVTRAEIESIRGVGSGHAVKALMEAGLVRVIGRSDLPGRPFLFGTTAAFLEHFGLKSLDELEKMK